MLIVGARAARKGQVRVVAGDARDTRVTTAPTPASFETVGLKAHRCNPHRAGHSHVWPGAMTGAAKVHRIDRSELGGIQDMSDSLRDSSLPHRRYVLRAGPVTGLTRHPRDEMVGIKLARGR